MGNPIKTILLSVLVVVVVVGCGNSGNINRATYFVGDADPATEVERTIIRMVNAIDTKTWDVALSHFSEEVFVDYSSLSGQAGASTSSKDLVDGWKQLLKEGVKTHHLLGNFDVRIDGTNAESFSHVYASHQAKGAGTWDAYGLYHHKLKKTPDGWKIGFKKLIMHGQKGNRTFLQEISKP